MNKNKSREITAVFQNIAVVLVVLYISMQLLLEHWLFLQYIDSEIQIYTISYTTHIFFLFHSLLFVIQSGMKEIGEGGKVGEN